MLQVTTALPPNKTNIFSISILPLVIFWFVTQSKVRGYQHPEDGWDTVHILNISFVSKQTCSSGNLGMK